jgi:hypothetical protein
MTIDHYIPHLYQYRVQEEFQYLQHKRILIEMGIYITMSLKILIRKIEPILNKRGFVLDSAKSAPRSFAYVFSKGEPEIENRSCSQSGFIMKHYDEMAKLDEADQIKYIESFVKQNDYKVIRISREEIIIYKHRFFPTITVDLRSLLKKEVFCSLWELAGFLEQKWWSIETKEAAADSLKEITDLLDKYAWDWFELE